MRHELPSETPALACAKGGQRTFATALSVRSRMGKAVNVHPGQRPGQAVV